MGDHEILASLCKEMGLDVDKVVSSPFTEFINEQLCKLDLSYNQLNTVPDSITKLSDLETLDLAFNQLSTVPDSISQLSNLKLLDLSDNPLPDHLTKSFTGTNLQQLLEELDQQHTKRLAEEQAARERLEQEQAAKERLERERLEQERLKQQRITQFYELAKLPIAGGSGKVTHPELAKEWGMSMESAYDMMVQLVKEGKLTILRQEGADTRDDYTNDVWVVAQQDTQLEESLTTLEKILNRYDSIELGNLAALLHMEKLQLEMWLLDLPDETSSSFRINDDKLIIDQSTINQHIAALLESFKTKTAKR